MQSVMVNDPQLTPIHRVLVALVKSGVREIDQLVNIDGELFDLRFSVCDFSIPQVHCLSETKDAEALQCNREGVGKRLWLFSYRRCIFSSCRVSYVPHGITTAVTGPPPGNYDLKTRVIGGSRSPHGYTAIAI